jgi:uncharacterized protein YjbJ (UPF0337 family)
MIMHADIVEGKWKQMRGDLRSWWGKLTDNDLERIGGKKDRLLGMLQEKYGYTREAAQQEIDRRFKEYDERMSAPGTGKKDQAMGSTPNQHEASVHQQNDDRLGVTEQATATMTKPSQPIAAVGEKMGSLAGVIREKAPHEGAAGTAATTVADKLDAAGSYLQAKNLDHMMSDLSGMIRRYPVPSLLIGLGIGYLLARGTRR